MATTYPSPWHAHALQRVAAGPAEPLTPPARMEWTPHRGYGPGAELLGADLRGRHVLELGCGPGHNAAHLAHHKGARVFYSGTIDMGEARRALDLVDKAAALVSLEGPQEVAEAAWEVYNEGSAGLSDYERSGDVRASWIAAVQAGCETDLRAALDRIRYHLLEQVQPPWRPTGKTWILEALRDPETCFPQVPTHTELGARTVLFSPEREARLGVLGNTRLVRPADGGAPVPYYETVRPSADLIRHLRAGVEAYLSACRPLVEGGTVPSGGVEGILRYALNAKHGSSPEREFSLTAGDVGNDLLQFVSAAEATLYPEETD